MKVVRRFELDQYIPHNAINKVADYQEVFNFQLKLSKPRTTKLGDFRVMHKNHIQISVNENLNKYEFLIVLLHEIAHLMIWKNYKRAVKPHGKEWKLMFRDLIHQFLALKCFPEHLDEVIRNCLKKSALSTVKCTELTMLLKSFDGHKDPITYLRDIPFKAEFALNRGKRFVKLHKIRTRYKCRDVHSGKFYTVHPLAEVVWYKVG